VFVPGYYNGQAPFGQFTYNHLRVMNGWYTSKDFRYDVGGAILNKNILAGQVTALKVSQRVGNLGTIWNIPMNQHFHAMGYPSAAPFNGLTLQIVTAAFGATDGTLNFGIGNDLTPGSSGGPWIYKFRSLNRVNGLNSYKYTTVQPLAMYTPYFNTAVGSLINCLINSGPGIQRCAPPAAL
jgi:V8-like Glu-specific endopeptidase